VSSFGGGARRAEEDVFKIPERRKY